MTAALQSDWAETLRTTIRNLTNSHFDALEHCDDTRLQDAMQKATFALQEVTRLGTIIAAEKRIATHQTAIDKERNMIRGLGGQA